MVAIPFLRLPTESPAREMVLVRGHIRGCRLLSHHNLYGVPAFAERHRVALHALSVKEEGAHALVHSLGIFHLYDILRTAEFAANFILLGRCRQTRINRQTVVGGFDAKDELRHLSLIHI